MGSTKEGEEVLCRVNHLVVGQAAALLCGGVRVLLVITKRLSRETISIRYVFSEEQRTASNCYILIKWHDSFILLAHKHIYCIV